MILAEHASRSDKSVLTEPPRCLKVAHPLQGGGEIVRDVHGEVALIAEYPPRPGESALTEMPCCLDLTEHPQITGQFVGIVHDVG